MEVFFTASKSYKNEYQHVYDAILKAIKKHGDSIISLEVQNYDYLIDKKILKSLPQNQVHYTWLRKGINRANCVILEISRDSFRLGHEATLALLYNKPVLCLSNKTDYSDAIIDPKFYAKKYSKVEEIDGIVKNFLEDVENKHLAIRKNIYITPEYTNFLEWYGKKFKKNSSVIIRQLIEDLMKKNPQYGSGIISDLSFTNNTNE